MRTRSGKFPGSAESARSNVDFARRIGGRCGYAMLTRRLARLRLGVAKGHRYVMANLHKEDGVNVKMGGARMD